MKSNSSIRSCGNAVTNVPYKISMLQKIQNMLRNTPIDAMLLFLAMGISLLGDSSLYVLLPIYAADIGIPVAAVGVLLSVNRFVRLGTNYYVQRLNNKIGSRNLFLLSIILASVTTFFYGLPAGFIVFAVSRAFWGGCWSAMRLVCLTKVGENSSEADRGTLTGVFNSTVRIGSLAATLLGGILAELVGFRNTYYIFGAATLILGLPLVISSGKWCKQQSIEREGIRKSENMTKASNSHKLNKNSKISIGLKSAYFLSFLNSWIGSGLLTTTIGYILKVRFGSDVSIFTVSIGISVAASFLASLKWFYGITLPVFSGKISDRHGRFNLVIITCSMQAISLIAIAFAHSFLAISLGIVFAFAGSTALTSILDAVAVDHHCMNENKNILSSFMTWNDLGAAIGAIAGFSMTVAIGYNIMYLICALTFTVTLGVISFKPTKLLGAQA